jgi:hypothetical protein
MVASYVIFDYQYDKYDDNYPKNHEISKIIYRMVLFIQCTVVDHDVLETEEETNFLLRKAEFSQVAGLEIFPGN